MGIYRPDDGRDVGGRIAETYQFSLDCRDSAKALPMNMNLDFDDETVPKDGYRLIDFGDGRKLEWFAGRVLDRPSPAASGERKERPELWSRADSVFQTAGRRWIHRTAWDGPACVAFEGFKMPLFPSPFGHVGVFPEQAANWRWLSETAPQHAAAVQQDSNATAQRALNLFAYTGASSIVMARSGMPVAHVDAAKPNVTAARTAAQLNGLGEHPIRYLVDDAAKFVAREVRRRNRYQTIVLDPPAYGHGPRGKAWRLERDLWPLLDDCLSLVDPHCFRILVTGHSPQVGADDVVEYLGKQSRARLKLQRDAFSTGIRCGRLSLKDLSGRELDAGFFVRWTHPQPEL